MSINPEFHTQLNQETGRLQWAELETHFARGVVIKIDAQLDLLDVADAMANDDKAKFSLWLNKGQVAKAETEDALRWRGTKTQFWAIVIAPWVLVQEIGLMQ